MILQALVKHYETLARAEKISQPGWCSAKVSYGLELNRKGELVRIPSLKQSVLRGKKEVMLPVLMRVPEMVTRTVGIVSNFLCDNSKYLLGIDADGSSEQNRLRYEAAKEKHLAVLQDMSNDSAEAIRNFFLNWEPTKAREHLELLEKWDGVTEGGNLVFYVNHQFAQEQEEIAKVWTKLSQKEEGTKELCMVTGKHSVIARTHSAIKGVLGAQSSGAMLVSFNAPSFESYGREQSYNAPVGKYAMFAYTTVLNHLLAQKEYVFTLGDTTFVFWAESGEEQYQAAFSRFMNPGTDNQEEIKGFFENLMQGKAIDIDGIQLDMSQKFYVLGLSPNAARISVRFFFQNSFGAMLQNIKKHYLDMELIKPIWDEREHIGVWSTLLETVNMNSKDKKPLASMTTGVFQAILFGGRYPESLFGNTLLRIRADQGKGKVTRGRAAIVKAYLIRNCKNNVIEGGMFVALNEECKEVAYVLGREFAVLEAIQEEASSGINATIKDRYFNSACATPALVFPILFKLKENHIRKIDKLNQRKRYYEVLITKLQGMLEVDKKENLAYPKRLTLEEQGMFILGYYHQMQKRFEKKEDKLNG